MPAEDALSHAEDPLSHAEDALSRAEDKLRHTEAALRHTEAVLRTFFVQPERATTISLAATLYYIRKKH